MPKARKVGEHGWVIIPPLLLGGLPRYFYFLFLSVSMAVLKGLNVFGTRLQSLWIMFFFCQKRFSLWSEKPNAGQNPF